LDDDPPQSGCSCATRPDWARVDDDGVMQWPVLELGEWEELRQCATCGRLWLAAWPEELESGMIVCALEPRTARRLRDIDRAATLRAYCLSRLEEHLGAIRERKLACRKMGCDRPRLTGAGYCLEHVIADRFGRHLAKLDGPSSKGRGSR
jgi:hypothetical protein